MKKYFALALVGSLALSIFVGCKESVTYKDGTYTGRSSLYEGEDGSDDGNGYGEVSITIQDGTITDCSFLTYELDGTLKDEDYGKEGGQVANKDYYNKAQKANAACAEYANMLISSGSLDDVDAISGATINYNEFVEAVENALAEAAE